MKGKNKKIFRGLLQSYLQIKEASGLNFGMHLTIGHLQNSKLKVFLKIGVGTNTFVREDFFEVFPYV